MTTPAPETPEGRRAHVWTALALAIFALATASLFHGLANEDPTRVVPQGTRRWIDDTGLSRFEQLGEFDYRYVVWLVSRNARTLLTRPWTLFAGEPCFPVENSLAFAEPAITLGLVGIPAWIVSRDPIATFNFVVIAIAGIAAIAVFLLVREWTGIPAAGIVAGLLYAFHEIKSADLIHVFLWDNAWTVFALWFATRLAKTGRWRDGIGLGISIGLQAGGAVFPMVAAAVLALPILVWLLARHGVREQRFGPWALAAALAGLASLFVYLPYLELQGQGLLPPTRAQVFMPFAWMRPGGPFFPGWVALVLAVAALALGRRVPGGGARWALLIGCLLVLNLASGGNRGDLMLAEHRGHPLPPELPSLYTALAAVVPGLAVSRGPGALFSGTHLALCLLAGLGAAALIRITPARWIPLAAAALVLVAYADTLRPRTLGFTPRIAYEFLPLAPRASDLVFFETLAGMGNQGPILEVPVRPYDFVRGGLSMLLAAYHHRPTSQCYNAYAARALTHVKALSEQLPESSALRELRQLGFTTIVVHHNPAQPFAGQRLRRFVRFADGGDAGLLTKLHGDEFMTAFAIGDDDGAGS